MHFLIETGYVISTVAMFAVVTIAVVTLAQSRSATPGSEDEEGPSDR